MDLPKWDFLKTHYPAKDAETVFKMIGGKVELNYDIRVFNNACTIRVSKALNGVGGAHLIAFFKDTSPNGKFESQVSSGKSKKWYIFRVKMLIKHMKAKYGNPEEFTPAEYKLKLKGRKGIIIFEVSDWGDATGHADLWDGKKCLWKGYGEISTKILFWEASK